MGSRLGLMALAVAAMTATLPAGSSFAADVYLVAKQFNKTVAGDTVVMWGFATDADSNLATVGTETPSVPGPLITVPPGDTTLTIHVRNDLSAEGVSVVIPGQIAAMSPVRFTDGQGRQRVRSFTAETAPGNTGNYTWSNLKPGSYVYRSGTHPAVQVQMGLYGAVKHDAAAGQVYLGSAYDSEVLLFYSEIDPGLHDAVATGNYGPTGTVTSTFLYKPRYFLINGEPFASPGSPIALGATPGTVLIRLLSASLDTHVPTLLPDSTNPGPTPYWSLVAEDGNPYPDPRPQYSAYLTAGKTLDALWVPTAPGTYPVNDRMLGLTTDGATAGGMLAHLQVGAVPPPGAPSQSTSTLLLSHSPTRSSPSALRDATVSGNAYIFSATPAEATSVTYYLDNVPHPGGNVSPFDFAGGSGGAANPFDSNTLADGTHIIRAQIQYADGHLEDQVAPFSVNNEAVCGDGVVSTGEQCDDGNTSGGDCCSSTCQLEANGSACDDGDPCTTADACNAGVCAGSGQLACSPCEMCDPGSGECVVGPLGSCRAATKAQLAIRDKSPNIGDVITWKWVGASNGGAAEFGAPESGDAYSLCVFDQTGLRGGRAGAPQVTFKASVPADAACAAPPCWKRGKQGIRYRNHARAPEGVDALTLRAGAARATITFKGKGEKLSNRSFGLPAPPLAAPLRVQLQASNGACWEAGYQADGYTSNANGKFKGKSK